MGRELERGVAQVACRSRAYIVSSAPKRAAIAFARADVVAYALFQPAKHAYLRDIVSLRTPTAARESVSRLNREYDEAATNAKRLRIARATQLAANRAGVSLKRGRLGAVERKQLREVAGTYSRAAERMFRSYNHLLKD